MSKQRETLIQKVVRTAIGRYREALFGSSE